MSASTAVNVLERVGIELRTAVERGDLEDAQRLLAAYSGRVEECLKAIAGDDERIRALANDTKRMLDWAHEKISFVRAQAAADLDSLRSKLSYAEKGPAGIKTWEIEA
ncbi:MAG: hypothetical protein ACR2I2_04345 [Bryobacteraceae bacterium]